MLLFQNSTFSKITSRSVMPKMVGPKKLQRSSRFFVSQCLVVLVILTLTVVTLFVGVMHVWLLSIIPVFSFTTSASTAPFDSDLTTSHSVSVVLPIQSVCTGCSRAPANCADNESKTASTFAMFFFAVVKQAPAMSLAQDDRFILTAPNTEKYVL